MTNEIFKNIKMLMGSMSYDRFILRAILRVLRKDENMIFDAVWQRWLRLSRLPSLRIAILPDGARVLIRPGTFDVTAIKEIFSRIYDRYFELKTSEIIIDIGAHIGIFTIYVRNNPEILAFEPNPENYILLKYNIAFNRLKNVNIYPYALGEKKGLSSFSYLNITRGLVH